MMLAIKSLAVSAYLLTPSPFLPRAAVAPKIISRCSLRVEMMAEPEPASGFERFVGTLLQVAEDATKAAGEAVDDYVNAGWQVKKRAGSALPEIRPSATNIERKAERYLNGDASPERPKAAQAPALTVGEAPVGLAGPTGELAQIDNAATSLVTSNGALELQSEFCSFLAPREGVNYRTTPQGEIVFASRDDLAQLVAEFSYGKLQELAAASRALARYVEDLETELEAADDAVVKLRREASATEKRYAEVSTMNDQLVSQAEELMGSISKSESDLEATKQDLAQAEKAAELAAEQLLETQKSASSAAEASQSEISERAVKLETELMAAEAKASELAGARDRLQSSLISLEEKREAAEKEREAEAKRVKELTEAAEAAEKKAEAAAEKLSDSESSVESLEKQLKELQAALELQQKKNGASGAKNGKAANGASSATTTAKTTTTTNGASSPAAKKNGAVKSVAEFEFPGGVEAGEEEDGSASGSFDDEAAKLTKEIEAQLSKASSQSATSGGVDLASGVKLAALSRMRKADLQAECEARKLDPKGTVAELRAALRVERKRDGLIGQLMERGYSEAQARSALGNTGWDVDAAAERLTKG